MVSFRPPLLLTRPKAASDRFSGEFRARFGADWPVVISPLMQTEWLTVDADLTGATGLIFTSETAVRGFARMSVVGNLPAYCVGPRTADAARLLGYDVHVGPGDALGLVRMIADMTEGVRLIYPHGLDVAQDIGKLLDTAGIETISFAAYDQRAIAMTHDAQLLLQSGGPVLLPLFSLRSTRLFARAAPTRQCALIVVAISAAVADAAKALDPDQILVAGRPEGAEVIATLYDFVESGTLG